MATEAPKFAYSWHAFNSWARDYKESTNRGPGVKAIREWWEANADLVWPDPATRPSVDLACRHAKGLRSKHECREYFRKYRAMLKVKPGYVKKKRPHKARPRRVRRRAEEPEPHNPAVVNCSNEERRGVVETLTQLLPQRPERARHAPSRFRSAAATTVSGKPDDSCSNGGHGGDSDGGRDESDRDRDERDRDRDESDRDRDESDRDHDESDRDRDESDGDGDESDGDCDESDGDRDESDGDCDESDGDRDESDGEASPDGDSTSTDETCRKRSKVEPAQRWQVCSAGPWTQGEIATAPDRLLPSKQSGSYDGCEGYPWGVHSSFLRKHGLQQESPHNNVSASCSAALEVNVREPFSILRFLPMACGYPMQPSIAPLGSILPETASSGDSRGQRQVLAANVHVHSSFLHQLASFWNLPMPGANPQLATLGQYAYLGVAPFLGTPSLQRWRQPLATLNSMQFMSGSDVANPLRSRAARPAAAAEAGRSVKHGSGARKPAVGRRITLELPNVEETLLRKGRTRRAHVASDDDGGHHKRHRTAAVVEEAGVEINARSMVGGPEMSFKACGNQASPVKSRRAPVQKDPASARRAPAGAAGVGGTSANTITAFRKSNPMPLDDGPSPNGLTAAAGSELASAICLGRTLARGLGGFTGIEPGWDFLRQDGEHSNRRVELAAQVGTIAAATHEGATCSQFATAAAAGAWPEGGLLDGAGQQAALHHPAYESALVHAKQGSKELGSMSGSMWDSVGVGAAGNIVSNVAASPAIDTLPGLLQQPFDMPPCFREGRSPVVQEPAYPAGAYVGESQKRSVPTFPVATALLPWQLANTPERIYLNASMDHLGQQGPAVHSVGRYEDYTAAAAAAAGAPYCAGGMYW